MPLPNRHSLQIISTKDGSQTILNDETGSTYHSRHGALTESKHVFIDKGLRKVVGNGMTEISLLEMGFGTGLNALVTAQLAAELNITINYHALELFPVPQDIWSEYELPEELSVQKELFQQFHQAEWNESVKINNCFTLTKHKVSLLKFVPTVKFDLVYYDAFEPETQPELWTQSIFDSLFSWMNENAILTTYCCKGYVRRNMIGAGFEVDKVPGPPGKREMIVANRPL